MKKNKKFTFNRILKRMKRKIIIDYIKNAWHFYRIQEKCSLYHSIKWTIDDVYVDFIAR